MGQLVKVKGITLSGGQDRKGTLCASAGDNLGSHNIGGFVENFSRSLHFSLLLSLGALTEQFSPIKIIYRAMLMYRTYLQQVSSLTLCLTSSLTTTFVSRVYLHVLAMTFLKVLSLMFWLYTLNILLQKTKRFTYQELNKRINQFKYIDNEAHDKPFDVNPGSEKLGGHAVQNWCFLRLLPVLVGDKIESPAEDEVWQLVLRLQDIVEFVCAHAISTGQTAYLRVLIDDYLHFRMVTFSDSPLKPKHHYVSHYPELILRFGPLIRLWTLRFESKHTYFKQCARKLHNFKKPVCYSC